MMKKIVLPSGKSLFSASFATFNKKKPSVFDAEGQRDSNNSSVNSDAQRIFQRFFNQNPPKESEKSFFDMNYGQKEETTTFNPHKILGVRQGASQQAINEAYRKIAMQNHPRINSTPEAEQKFINVSKAYRMLTQTFNNNRPSPSESFMQDFDTSVRQQMNAQAGVSNVSPGVQYKVAELYSESRNIKRFGDSKQIKTVKQYNRDGNLFKITRIEYYKEDGSLEVIEMYNDGEDVKTKRFSVQGEQKTQNKAKQVQSSGKY